MLASSADVYDTSDHDHFEGEPLCPRNPYGLSKVLAEEIVAYGCRKNPHLNASILRFFNVYGPRDTTPHIIPRAIELVTNPLLNEVRMGYLGGSRDFVHVSDAVEAILMCIEQASSGCEVFNVGTGVATSICRVVQIIQELTGDHKPVAEVQSQFRCFDRKSLTADIRKITSQLGWYPRIKLSQGLERLLVEMNLILPAKGVA